MGSRYRPKKNYKRNIQIQLLAIVYVLFLIGYQLTSPTTAYFTDATVIEGAISITTSLDEEKEHENDNNQVEQQVDEPSIDQESDTKNASQLPDNNEGTTEEGHNVDLSSENNDDQKATDIEEAHDPSSSLELETSDMATKMDGEKVEDRTEIAGESDN